MNSTPPDDDRLETLLRSPLPPLPDDGFSTRVLARLPPSRQTAQSTFLRGCFIGAGAFAGLLYLLLDTRHWPSAVKPLNTLSVALARLTTPLLDPVVLGALALSLASVAVAFYSEIRDRLTS